MPETDRFINLAQAYADLQRRYRTEISNEEEDSDSASPSNPSWRVENENEYVYVTYDSTRLQATEYSISRSNEEDVIDEDACELREEAEASWAEVFRDNNEVASTSRRSTPSPHRLNTRSRMEPVEILVAVYEDMVIATCETRRSNDLRHLVAGVAEDENHPEYEDYHVHLIRNCPVYLYDMLSNIQDPSSKFYRNRGKAYEFLLTTGMRLREW